MHDKITNKDITKIAKGAGIVALGDVTSRVIHFMSLVLIARTIGADVYGVFLLALTVINIGAMFCTAGFTNGVLHFVSMYKAKNDLSRIKGIIFSALKVSSLLSVISGIILFFSAHEIANNIFHIPMMENVLKALIVIIFIKAVMTIFLSSIWGFQLIKYKVYVEKIIQPITRLILLSSLFVVGFRLSGVLSATVISFLVSCCFALYYLIKTVPFYRKDLKPIFETKKLIAFSLPLLSMGFLALLAQHIDMLMIGYFMSSIDVGIYGAVSKIAIFGILAFSAFNPVFKPIISELHSRGEKKKIEHIFKLGTRWIFYTGLPIYLVMIFFAKPILRILGPNFPTGGPCLIILSVGYLFRILSGPTSNVIMMTGRPKINLLNSIVFCGLNVMLNYILIPKYGIVGAATATAISIATINIIRLTEVYHFLKMHPFKLNFFKPILSGMLAIFITRFLGFLPVPLVVIVFICVYTVFLALFGFEEDDRVVLKGIVRRLKWQT